MKCPTDQSPLQITERQGIEIDYCPECRGVWLDRGELDKIIERADGGTDPTASPRRSGGNRTDRDREDRRGSYDDDYDDDRSDRSGKRRKKSSLLGELFEFG